MARVAAQGDMRPMAASREAMDDLRRILDGRSAFYSKADLTVDTSGHGLAESLEQLRTGVLRLRTRRAIGQAGDAHQSTHALDEIIVARFVLVRAGMAKTCKRAVD